MAENFYTILTAVGKAKIANAHVLGTNVNLTHLAVGDGNGSYYNPTESQTALKRELWRGTINSITIDERNPNWIVIEAVIPATDGGFTIREVGIFDDAGDLIAVGKYPETYKPVLAEGSAKDLYIRMILEVSNTSSITLKIDPAVILATKKQVEEAEARVRNELTAHLAETLQQGVHGIATTGDITYYVDPVNGDDNNPGTSQSQPLKTIQAAVNKIPPLVRHNIKIKLRDGEYNEYVVIENIFGRRFTIEGNTANKEAVIVNGYIRAENLTGFVLQYFTIKNFPAYGIQAARVNNLDCNNLILDGSAINDPNIRAGIRINSGYAFIRNILFKNFSTISVWDRGVVAAGNGGRVSTSNCQFENVDLAFFADYGIIQGASGSFTFNNVQTQTATRYGGQIWGIP